jgi:hypothetical protein
MFAFHQRVLTKPFFFYFFAGPLFEMRKWLGHLLPACVVSGSRGLFSCFENETLHGSEMESRPRFVSEAIRHVPQRGL